MGFVNQEGHPQRRPCERSAEGRWEKEERRGQGTARAEGTIPLSNSAGPDEEGPLGQQAGRQKETGGEKKGRRKTEANQASGADRHDAACGYSRVHSRSAASGWRMETHFLP